MPEFPRTLVISPCVFNYESGSGVTFSNLFGGWPREKLANLHSSPQAPSHDVCSNFFRLTSAEIAKPWPFQDSQAPVSLGAAPSSLDGKTSSLDRFIRRFIIGNSGLPRKFIMSPALSAWLEDFKPEVIYTVLGPLPHLEAIRQVRDRFKTRLVIHFMDDWYGQAYTTGLFRHQRKKMLALFHELVGAAQAHLAISDQMAKALGRRYGVSMEAFQNSIDVEVFSENISRLKKTRPPSAAMKLLYFGSVLGFAQLESLELAAKAAERLKQEGFAIAFDIVTSRECLGECDALRKHASVNLRVYGDSPHEFAQALSQADALLLPSGFQKDVEDFLRYSMPTKVPGYMASQVPVLVVGPPGIAQVQYAMSEGWGYGITTPEPGAIATGLKKILTDEALRQQLTSTAIKTARLKHDLSKTRSRFQQIVSAFP